MSARRAADNPLWALIGLAALLAVGLGLYASWLTLPYSPDVACSTPAATFAARAGTLGALAPLGLLAVMLVSAALALAHQLWATRRVLRLVLARRAAVTPRVRRLAREAGLADGQVILVDDHLVYTFAQGLLRPGICLSRGLADLLDDDELRAVLRHEAHHRRHRDPLRILVGRCAASSLFFLPIAGDLRNAFLAGKEIAADRDAAGAGSDIALARALVKMLRARSPAWPAGVLAIGALSPTQARVQHMLAPGASRLPAPAAASWIASLAVLAGVLGFGTGSAVAIRTGPLHAMCSAPAVASATVGPVEAAHDVIDSPCLEIIAAPSCAIQGGWSE